MRKAIEFIKDNYDHPLIGAEIGVATGANARNILENLSIERLFLVDIRWYNNTLNNLEKYLNKTCWLLMSSSKASELLNIEFDFVYIDAKHTYSSVKMDIEVWLPKIKKGGVLCGHDYQLKGVKKAVDELIVELHTQENENGKTIDWWYVI